MLSAILYLEEKGNGATVALVDQHAVALTLDEYFGRKDLCIREITSFKNRSNEESGGLCTDWYSKRLLVNLAERGHS